jgi:hypothetical protein
VGCRKEERLAVFGEMAEQLMYSEDEGEVLDVLDEVGLVILIASDCARYSSHPD